MSDKKMRRYSTFPFPLSKYIPGCGVHPRDMQREHVPAISDSADTFSASTWEQSEHYLYGIDLFNHGYYWEAHEVLEGIWNEAGPGNETGIFIQGIIQLSAAILKHNIKHADGARNLLKKSCEKIERYKGEMLGINTAKLIRDAQSYISNESNSPPFILLNKQIEFTSGDGRNRRR